MKSKKTELFEFLESNFPNNNIDGLVTEEEIEDGDIIFRHHGGNKTNFISFIDSNFGDDLLGEYNDNLKLVIKKWTKSQQL